MKKIFKYLAILVVMLLSSNILHSQVYTTVGTNPGQLGPILTVGYEHYNLIFYGYSSYQWIFVEQNGDEFKGNHIKSGIGMGFNNWTYDNVYLSVGINYNKYYTKEACDCVNLNKLWKVSFDLAATAFMGKKENIPVSLRIDFRNMEVGISVGYLFKTKKYVH